jgi:hypothetical protein
VRRRAAAGIGPPSTAYVSEPAGDDARVPQRPCAWKSMLYCMAGALLEGPASAGPARNETTAMAANVIFFNMVIVSFEGLRV